MRPGKRWKATTAEGGKIKNSRAQGGEARVIRAPSLPSTATHRCEKSVDCALHSLHVHLSPHAVISVERGLDLREPRHLRLRERPARDEWVEMALWKGGLRAESKRGGERRCAAGKTDGKAESHWRDVRTQQSALRWGQ